MLSISTTTLSVKDYATHSGLAQTAVRKLVKISGFPVFRIGNRYFIHAESADNWLGQQANNNQHFDNIYKN